MSPRRFGLLLAAVLAVLLAQPVGAADMNGRDPQVFPINGKSVRLSQKFLAQLRSNWATGQAEGPFVSAVKTDDFRWALDLISIREVLREPSCKKLRMTGIEKLVGKVHVLEGKEIRGGSFDELWRIEACGEARQWRVLNVAGTEELLVYEVEDAAF